VTVDVGGGKTLQLPTGKLKIGLSLQGMATAFNQALVAGAQSEAAKYGYEITVMDAAFDLNKQLNQIQTAASNKTYDVVAVEPLAAPSLCDVTTKTLPDAGIVAVAIGTPCQTNLKEAGDDLWVPGLLTTVAGDTSLTYARAFFEQAATRYAGPQKVVLVTGPQVDPLVIVENQLLKELAAKHPDFKVEALIYGDWTTPTAQSKTLQYLQSHPETTVVLSAYSPDVSRGVVAALTAQGKLGKLKFADVGASKFTVDQIKAGNIDFSMPYYPDQYGVQLVDALHQAQTGATVPHFTSNVPAEYGTVDKPVVISKDNVGSFTARY
jgi:ribose transport system substrate-binding protein